MQLFISFLADPEAPLDTSCKDEVFGLNFTGIPALAQQQFGTGSMYGGTP